ncbi:Coiled-coil domain-containing protein R3HCC1L [Holothuria leucospilota]|uniref:Coiled-coil domain-containing protein R3HCC1L n=1 Tax=Holothuria leucospilota TaxID=206669 RepID=A0A9Q0YNH0_HOLLE|nr:Coiled-coil domain-containing protein R3HCC1L [Holothuria leucospilota]
MNRDVRNQQSSSPKRNRRERPKRPDQQLYVPKSRRGQQQTSSPMVEKVPPKTKATKDADVEVNIQQVAKSADVTVASEVDTKNLVGKDVTSGETESPVVGVSQHKMPEKAEALMPHMNKAQREKDVPDSHSKEDAPTHSTEGSIGSTRTSKQAEAALRSDVRTEASPQGVPAVGPDDASSIPVSKSLNSNHTATDGGTAAVEKNAKNKIKPSNTSDITKYEEFDQNIVTAQSADSGDQIHERDPKSSNVRSISRSKEQSEKSQAERTDPNTDSSSCNIDQNNSVIGKEEEGSKGGIMSNTEKVVEVRTCFEPRNEMSPSIDEDSEKSGEAIKGVTSSGVEDEMDKKEDKVEPDDQNSVGVSQADDAEEDDDDSWDKMFDDSGESLLPDEVQDLTKEIKKTKITVKKPKNDYDNYNPKDSFDYSAYEHVIELCDFPAEFKTQDLITTFSAFKSKGFDIKWVDDTHALAIFASPMIAQDALSLSNPMLRTRHLSLATRQSKLKAKECVDSLQPFKPRPETSAIAARRLVSGALGIKTKISREQRDMERQKIKQVKEKRREDKKQTEDIWEGKI